MISPTPRAAICLVWCAAAAANGRDEHLDPGALLQLQSDTAHTLVECPSAIHIRVCEERIGCEWVKGVCAPEDPHVQEQEPVHEQEQETVHEPEPVPLPVADEGSAWLPTWLGGRVAAPVDAPVVEEVPQVKELPQAEAQRKDLEVQVLQTTKQDSADLELQEFCRGATHDKVCAERSGCVWVDDHCAVAVGTSNPTAPSKELMQSAEAPTEDNAAHTEAEVPIGSTDDSAKAATEVVQQETAQVGDKDTPPAPDEKASKKLILAALHPITTEPPAVETTEEAAPVKVPRPLLLEINQRHAAMA